MKDVGFALLSLSACSMRRVAVSLIGDALSGEGGVYASDDDPKLIQKTISFLLVLFITYVLALTLGAGTLPRLKW